MVRDNEENVMMWPNSAWPDYAGGDLTAAAQHLTVWQRDIWPLVPAAFRVPRRGVRGTDRRRHRRRRAPRRPHLSSVPGGDSGLRGAPRSRITWSITPSGSSISPW